MAEAAPRPLRLAHMAALVGLGALAILLSLAPLDARASATPSPDLLFCVAAFLALRRPAATPAILVLLLGLARDLAGGGPVGLGALTLWISIEWLKSRRDRIVRSVWSELLAVAAIAFLAPLAQLVILTLSFANSPPLTTLAAGGLATLVAYGAVALVMRFGLRIRGVPLEAMRLLGRPIR